VPRWFSPDVECIDHVKVPLLPTIRRSTIPAKTTRPRRAKRAAVGTRNSASAVKRHSPAAKLAELKQRLLEIADLGGAGAVLGWDQATYMPKGGVLARARQGALLSRLAHDRATDPALGRLLDELQVYAERLPHDADDACLIRVVRRDYERAIKVPADFIARWSEFGSQSFDAWTRARPANDFASMRPFLQKALDFNRQYAHYLGPSARVADPLIDGMDEGMTTASVLKLFQELRAALVPIVRVISEQPIADDSCLRGNFPEAAQVEFGLGVAKRYGYDTDRGRLDKTHHPFCTKFSAGDVRITTRVRQDDLGDCLL